MIAVFTAVLFALVASVTAWMGLRTGGTARALERLQPPAPPRTAALQAPSPATVWRDLLKRFSAALPESQGAERSVRRRLTRAGMRHPDAARRFRGVRAVTAAGCGVAGFLWSLHAGQDGGHLLLAAGGGVAVGAMLPLQYLNLRIRRRGRAIERALPNALDLMVVCVEAGLGIDQATVQVASELQFAHPEICDELTVVNLELRAGKRRDEALHNLADRAGVEEVKKLVAVLVQTDRFGTSVAQALRGHSDYLRTLSRQRAEERAAKLAVKLVFPIFFCLLPSLFVVTLAPALTHLVRDLIPLINGM